MSKRSFAGGAAILAIAVALSKVLSAVFKIPLDRVFLHAEGMAVFNGAYNIYVFFFTIATAGFPLALSKLVASSKNEDEKAEAFHTAFVFIETLLILCAIAIFAFAEPIAELIEIPKCASSLKAMSPALVFLGVTAALRGLFQGDVDMTPSAAAQVSDALGRCVVGFALAFAFMGTEIEKTAAAAMCGIPFGAFLSAVILACVRIKRGRIKRAKFSAAKLKQLVFIAIPVTLTSTAYPFFNMVDTLSVVPLLSGGDKMTAFGCLTRAATLYALPVSLTSAVSAGILPAIARSDTEKNSEAKSRDAFFALKLALLISAPCMAGFLAVPKPILNLLYDNADFAFLLRVIAPSAVFAGCMGVAAAILQGAGKSSATAGVFALSLIAKLLLNIILIPSFGIGGAAAATSIAYFLCALALFIMIFKMTDIRFKWLSAAVKIAVSALLCAVTAYFADKIMMTAGAVLCAAIVYIAAALLSGFVTKSDIIMLLGKDEANDRKRTV